ncbi:MAG TPA: tRNA pseudouridine(38-40) synthase TruA, partial [Candidatus Kapabacteria bacterium]|nr:tRNA pseudouridine(38-40) synthase TruA [Candidatus Kapabacteria bacterium]
MKLALQIEYDGTDFAGWQIQPGVRTVQGEIESAFTKLLCKKTSILGCGRTDAGVHAKALVAHTDVELTEAMPIWKVKEALNALTSEDIAIKDIRQVRDDFHARFSATERGYRYTISQTRVAIGRQYEWFIHNDLDIELLKSLSASLLGEFDFTSFSKLSTDVEHYRCTITRSEFEMVNDKLYFWISANRFVRGMVRALMGALIETAKGRIS